MDANSRKKPSQLEINDLIAEAVVTAEGRRNQAVELLSDEELAAVKGGISWESEPIIITCGMIEEPGLIDFSAYLNLSKTLL